MLDKVTPHPDKVLFEFMDNTDRSGNFVEESKGGLSISTSDQMQTKRPRWAKVISAGSNVLNVTQGTYILIEPLQWTASIKYSGEKFWVTDKQQILCSTQSVPSEYDK